MNGKTLQHKNVQCTVFKTFQASYSISLLGSVSWLDRHRNTMHGCYNSFLYACIRLATQAERDCSFLFVQLSVLKRYTCVCVGVYSTRQTCTMDVCVCITGKLVWPLLFRCNSCIDAQIESLLLSPEDSNTDRGLRVRAHLVDKQSEHHKGTIATILLPTQPTRPFKMSNEKAVARVQCSIDSKWAHHLTTMPNFWTLSILDTKWWSTTYGYLRNCRKTHETFKAILKCMKNSKGNKNDNT